MSRSSSVESMFEEYPMKRLALCLLFTCLVVTASQADDVATPECDYIVVVSKQTHDDPDWQQVTAALLEKWLVDNGYV